MDRKQMFAAVAITMVLIFSACNPNPSDTPAPVQAPSQMPTYKVIFTFKEPVTINEKFIYENNDVVTYMNWVRTKENAQLANALTKAALGDPTSLLDMVEMAGPFR